uniref:Uncharacterized protein n=1 Tax=Oryza sativa subsp. japonica TaxID=39947 RepID=Q69SN6_ORYSJ|nr:hypothetical protein [Oryza sativa Japonica Group]
MQHPQPTRENEREKEKPKPSALWTASTWQHRAEASPPPSCISTHHFPPLSRRNREGELQLSSSISSLPAAKKKDAATRRRDIVITNSFSFRIPHFMPTTLPFDGNVAVPTGVPVRAPGAAAATSSPLPSI